MDKVLTISMVVQIKEKAAGDIEIVSVHPSFRPTFLSGTYLKKYLRYQLETS
jgi:hypothetical protein